MWTSTDFKTYLKKYIFFKDMDGWENEVAYKTVLEIDNMVFMNMVETSLSGMNTDSQEFQSLICEGDGIYACEFGNWMAIRHLENFVFLSLV